MKGSSWPAPAGQAVSPPRTSCHSVARSPCWAARTTPASVLSVCRGGEGRDGGAADHHGVGTHAAREQVGEARSRLIARAAVEGVVEDRNAAQRRIDEQFAIGGGEGRTRREGQAVAPGRGDHGGVVLLVPDGGLVGGVDGVARADIKPDQAVRDDGTDHAHVEGALVGIVGIVALVRAVLDVIGAAPRNPGRREIGLKPRLEARAGDGGVQRIAYADLDQRQRAGLVRRAAERKIVERGDVLRVEFGGTGALVAGALGALREGDGAARQGAGRRVHPIVEPEASRG